MKMKIVHLVATCQGFGDGILLNPMHEKTLEGLRTGVYEQVQKDRPVQDVANDRLPIRNIDGVDHIGVPSTYLFAACNVAGRKVKVGKTNLATASTSMLPSIFFIKDRFLSFGPVDQVKWEVDQRRGCLPKDGTAVCLVRPLIPEWSFTVRIDIDEMVIKHEHALKVMEYAGRYAGLGDYRPGKKGPHGMFTVTKWIVNGQEFDLDKWNSVDPEPAADEPEDTGGEGGEGKGEGDLVEAGAGGGNGTGRPRATRPRKS